MTDGSGPNFGALWAYYDRATSSWKMSQACLPLTEDTPSVRSSVTWPTSGMTRNGRCSPLPMSARRTSENASGLWLTPSVEDAGRTGSAEAWGKWKIGKSTTNARLRNQIHWPTPRATDADRDRRGWRSSTGYPDKQRPILQGEQEWSEMGRSPPGCHTAYQWWRTEPDVGRVAHGVPRRVDRLRGLGNAIVPHCAEWIGRQLASFG